MARRDGGRGGRTIPGLSAALAAEARAFGQQWASQRSVDFADALERGELVTVAGSVIRRALSDRRYPGRWDEFTNDERMYTVSGDRLTPVDAAPAP